MAARHGSLNNHCEPKTLLCVCSNMWLTVVCFCKQLLALLLSCVCNWVRILVLPARPRVIATAATICAVLLPWPVGALAVVFYGMSVILAVWSPMYSALALWVISYLARHHIITGTWPHSASAFQALNFQPNTTLPVDTASCN